jgi:hypothetical protein
VQDGNRIREKMKSGKSVIFRNLSMHKRISRNVIVLTLSAIGIMISLIPIVDFMLTKDTDEQSHTLFFNWLDKINYFRWGWLVGFVFACLSMAGIFFWKPGTPLFRGFVLLLSIIAILLSVHWLFWLIVISNLPT